MVFFNYKLGVHIMKSIVCLAVALSMVLIGCSAPRGLAHRASRPISNIEEAQRTPLEIQFADNFVKQTTNTQYFVAQSPLGDNLNILAGDFYTNGLAQNCRKGYFFKNNSQIQFAVCKGSDEQYRVVKPLVD